MKQINLKGKALWVIHNSEFGQPGIYIKRDECLNMGDDLFLWGLHSKRDILDLMDYDDGPVDYALPQPWVDAECDAKAKRGTPEWTAACNDLCNNFAWDYHEPHSVFGAPLDLRTFLTEIFNQVRQGLAK